MTKGFAARDFDVVMAEQEQPHRHLADIAQILHTSALPTTIRDTALSIFQCLAEAEAHVHGSTIEEVHFHEVGAVDAIVDITGAAIALDTLGITQLYASPLPLTSGHVRTAHGLLPVPAPATLEILRRVNAPWKPCPVEGELVTPTGAAILLPWPTSQRPLLPSPRSATALGKSNCPGQTACVSVWANRRKYMAMVPIPIGSQ